MKISDYYSVNSCNSIFMLDKILKKRYKGESNEFIMEADGGFPMMTVLISNSYACVHYFKDKDDCGSYACNEDNFSDKNESIIFHVGNENDQTEIPGKMVIPVKQALCIAECFFINISIPGGVKWVKL